MEKYDYFQVTANINPGNIEVAHSWYDWLVSHGHTVWIDKIRDISGDYWYRVWRMGKGHRQCDNKDECTGIIIVASHPEIVEKFRENILSGGKA